MSHGYSSLCGYARCIQANVGAGAGILANTNDTIYAGACSEASEIPDSSYRSLFLRMHRHGGGELRPERSAEQVRCPQNENGHFYCNVFHEPQEQHSKAPFIHSHVQGSCAYKCLPPRDLREMILDHDNVVQSFARSSAAATQANAKYSEVDASDVNVCKPDFYGSHAQNWSFDCFIVDRISMPRENLRVAPHASDGMESPDLDANFVPPHSAATELLDVSVTEPTLGERDQQQDNVMQQGEETHSLCQKSTSCCRSDLGTIPLPYDVDGRNLHNESFGGSLPSSASVCKSREHSENLHCASRLTSGAMCATRGPIIPQASENQLMHSASNSCLECKAVGSDNESRKHRTQATTEETSEIKKPKLLLNNYCLAADSLWNDDDPAAHRRDAGDSDQPSKLLRHSFSLGATSSIDGVRHRWGDSRVEAITRKAEKYKDDSEGHSIVLGEGHVTAVDVPITATVDTVGCRHINVAPSQTPLLESTTNQQTRPLPTVSNHMSSDKDELLLRGLNEHAISDTRSCHMPSQGMLIEHTTTNKPATDGRRELEHEPMRPDAGLVTSVSEGARRTYILGGDYALRNCGSADLARRGEVQTRNVDEVDERQPREHPSDVRRHDNLSRFKASDFEDSAIADNIDTRRAENACTAKEVKRPCYPRKATTCQAKRVEAKHSKPRQKPMHDGAEIPESSGGKKSTKPKYGSDSSKLSTEKMSEAPLRKSTSSRRMSRDQRVLAGSSNVKFLSSTTGRAQMCPEGVMSSSSATRSSGAPPLRPGASNVKHVVGVEPGLSSLHDSISSQHPQTVDESCLLTDRGGHRSINGLTADASRHFNMDSTPGDDLFSPNSVGSHPTMGRPSTTVFIEGMDLRDNAIAHEAPRVSSARGDRMRREPSQVSVAGSDASVLDSVAVTRRRLRNTSSTQSLSRQQPTMISGGRRVPVSSNQRSCPRFRSALDSALQAARGTAANEEDQVGSSESVPESHVQVGVLEALDALPPTAPATRCPTVHQAHLQALNTFTIQELLPDPCAICLDEMIKGQSVARLPCGHCYHQACVKRWMVSSLLCPLCKRSLSSRAMVKPDFSAWA